MVWSGPLFQNPYQLSTIYGSTLPLDQPLLATSLRAQLVGPRVAIDIYGLGLQDRPGLPARSLMPTDRAKYRQVYQDDDVRIFENSAALQRAFLVGSARVAAGGRTIVEQLAMGSLDPRLTILLDGTSGEELGPGPPGEIGTVALLQHDPERVEVRVDAERPGYLVLDDRYEQGWQVTVDGRSAPLLRADALFRAVPVEAGTHDVVFTYEPWSVRIGAIVSLATLVVVPFAARWCAQ